MDQPAYAYKVFRTHFDRVAFRRRNEGFVALELGPGDSLLFAMLACAFGASTSYLIDVGHFAQDDLKPYRSMAELLSEKSLTIPEMQSTHSLGELLLSCGAQYLTQGLASLRKVPDETVDFIVSQAVLEHIRRDDFTNMMHELRRVLRPDGVCSHRVDLKDHLAGALNNLRFPEHIWETDLIANSGFYTNRIRFGEMLDLFKKARFNVQVIDVERWDRLPTPRPKLSLPFKQLPDEELCVSGFDVVLQPA
jgi:SAM-dependent methyltransferase